MAGSLMHGHTDIHLALCVTALLVIAGMPSAKGASMPARAPLFESGYLSTGLTGEVSLPNLAAQADGTIWCAFSHDNQAIMVTKTRDAGHTWLPPVKVLAPPRAGIIADPNVLVSGKRVTVYGTFVPSPSPPFTITETLAASTEDGGATWSAAVTMKMPHRYITGKVHVPVRLNRRTYAVPYSWDIPAETGKPVGDEGSMHTRCGVLLTRDGGRTWTPGGDIDIPESPMGADEPALVRLRSGDLFAVVRTSTPHPYETRSHDGGLTWDAPKPSRFRGFNTPSCLLRLKGGAILRVWDNSDRNRFPLVAAISTDECRTWSPPRTVFAPSPDLLGDPGAYSHGLYECYPSAAQAKDGTIVLVWWEYRAGHSRVRYARFDRAWIEEARRMPRVANIVAFGDSVTRGVRPGVPEPETFCYRLEQQLQAAGEHFHVVNAGVGGNNTRDALQRMDADVIAEEPKLVIVMFGVNDAAMVDTGPVARTAPRVSLAEYRANLAEIVRRAKAAGATVILCTPTPMTRAYDYSNMGEYARHDDMNYLLRDYAQAVRDLARETGTPVVDTFALFSASPERFALLKDGCHPWGEGHALIAGALLEPVRAALR